MFSYCWRVRIFTPDLIDSCFWVIPASLRNSWTRNLLFLSSIYQDYTGLHIHFFLQKQSIPLQAEGFQYNKIPVHNLSMFFHIQKDAFQLCWVNHDIKSNQKKVPLQSYFRHDSIEVQKSTKTAIISKWAVWFFSLSQTFFLHGFYPTLTELSPAFTILEFKLIFEVINES